MSNKEKENVIKNVLAEQDLLAVKLVTNVNHKPHPFMIGTKHVAYASDHHSGRLGEETCRKVPCAHPRCNATYEEHTSDNVCFLQLKRNGTNDEVNTILKNLVDNIEKNLVDGFAFVETTKKFRII